MKTKFSFTLGIGLLWLGSSGGLLSLLTGCDRPKGDYSKVDLVIAGGTVKMDGTPLEGVVVKFEDAADETFSYGVTDRNGMFVLQFDSEVRGVKTGNKVVRIQTVGSERYEPDGFSEGEDPDAKPKQKEKIPSRYNTKSELRLNVEKGRKKYDFELASQ